MSLRQLKRFIQSKWYSPPLIVKQRFNQLLKNDAKDRLTYSDVHFVLHGGTSNTKSKKIWNKQNTPHELNNNVNLLYGFIKDEGIKTILARITLHPTDVFYDLGSGVGNVCKYVFDHSSVKKCVGIEYDEDRYLESLPLVKKESNRLLTYEHGNFLDKNWSDATVIFMDSIGSSMILWISFDSTEFYGFHWMP